MTFLYILIAIPFYFAAGYCIAWARVGYSRRLHKIWNKTSEWTAEKSMRQQFYWMLFTWPVYLPLSIPFAVVYLFLPPVNQAPAGAFHVGLGFVRDHIDSVIEKSA